MTKHAPILLTPHLTEERRQDAVKLLQSYFAGILSGSGHFEGGWWDDFDPSGSRESSPNTFTVDDLLSASLLSADIPAQAILRILGDKARELSAGLERLGVDRDLADEPTEAIRELERTDTLWRSMRDIDGMGRTRTSKLIARKRPRLIPIYDSLVGDAVFGGTSVGQWSRLNAALRADNGALQRRLISLRQDAGLPDSISPLRIFDVIAWLDARAGTT